MAILDRGIAASPHAKAAANQLRRVSFGTWRTPSCLAAGLAILAATPLSATAGAKPPVQIIDDKYRPTVFLAGPQITKIPFGGTTRFSSLGTTIDRRTGFTFTRLVVTLNYLGGWRWYEAATDDSATAYEVTKLNSSVDGLCGVAGCSLTENVAIELPEPLLRLKVKTGFKLKLFAKSGDSILIDVTGEQIEMQLASLEKYRADNGLASLPSGSDKAKFGASFVPLPPALATVLRHPGLQALLIIAVVPASVADKAGLHVGDVIVEFAGQPVSAGPDLQAAVASVEVGKPVPIKMIRGINEAELTAQF